MPNVFSMNSNWVSNLVADASQKDRIPMEDLIAMRLEWKEGHCKNCIILKSTFGILSILSSSILIWMIARSHKGLSTTQHRLLLGLSIYDVITSLAFSTFYFFPPSDDSYIVWNARGNEATCDAQGFLFTFGAVGGILYITSLNLYYLAVVKYGKSDDYIRNKIEPLLHSVPMVVASTFSIVGLVRQHFNDDFSGLCYYPFHYPLHCQGYEVGEIRDGFEIPCGRGTEGAEIYYFFLFLSAAIPVNITIACLLMIYRAVKEQERKASRYGASSLDINPSTTSRSTASSSNASRPANRSNNGQSKSRAIMLMAFQYSFAWFLSHGIAHIMLSTVIDKSLQFIHGSLPSFSGSILVGIYFVCILFPLQGFYNLCFFMYPKVISARKVRRGQEKVSWCKAISEAFWSRGNETRKRKKPKKSSKDNKSSRRENKSLA